jgi:hypothetical protein
MIIGKNIHVYGFAGLSLQLLAYVIYSFFIGNSLILAMGALMAFFMLASGHKRAYQKKTQESEVPKASESAKESVKILSSLYAVIAGLSLTTAIKETCSLNNIFSSWGVVVFFSVALPFYHGATMFLVTNYYLKGFEGRRMEPLIDFFMLFLQAGALYSMAISITNAYKLICSISFLLLIDVMWVLFIIGRKWRSDAPREWVWLDFYMFAFFVQFWFFSEQDMWLLAFVTIFRTLTDYYVARHFYLP